VKTWTKAEESFLRKKVEEGVHPADFVNVLNRKFRNARTTTAIERKLLRLNLSISHCKKKDVLPTIKEISSIVKNDIQFEHLRSKIKILQKKYAAAIKTASLQEAVLDQLKTHINALPPVDFPSSKPVAIKDKEKVKDSEEELVLLLSDLHAGEVVIKEELNGLNEYNFDICTYRLKYLADSIRDIVKNKLRGYKFRKLNIFGLGDFVSGTIHEELVASSEGTIVESTINLAYVLAQMILELSVDFEEIKFTGIVGNHGRLTKQVQYKSRYVNWDYICYQLLSMFLANQKNVTFNIPKSFWTLETVNNFNFLLIHGDNIRSNLGIPWYGIRKVVSNLKELLESKDQRFHYVTLGHFHNLGLLDGVKGETMINGSVIGGNEFSIGAMFTSSQACQLFCGVHHKKGVTFRYKITVQDALTTGPVPYKYANNVPALGNLVEGLR